MRHEVLMEMSRRQLDQYGLVCGIDVTGKKSKKAKVALIEERRGRTADINVLGMTFAVPIRAMHDKRVVDLLNGEPLTDAQATELLAALLGEEQYEALVDRCTDEDGVVDVEAMGIAFATIFNSEELKNY